MTTTILRLGPKDRGRRLSRDEFETAAFVPGCKYEIIDGRLAVSLEPDPAENRVENWLYIKLLIYWQSHTRVLNYVTNKARVFVPDRPDLTAPEPDIAAYDDYPLEQPFGSVSWEDVSPVLVCEILSGDPRKDLERNVDLYLQIPSIHEYWVVDIRGSADEPTLIQHRRSNAKWAVSEFRFGTTFVTKLLPGFTLVIDPRK